MIYYCCPIKWLLGSIIWFCFGGTNKIKQKGLNSYKGISPISLCNPKIYRTAIIEYSFGDIYSRDGLDLKSKEIAVVAALTALGNARPQLKIHLNGALYTGSSVDELKEVVLQMCPVLKKVDSYFCYYLVICFFMLYATFDECTFSGVSKFNAQCGRLLL